MIPISTEKGLENYIPWSKTLSDLVKEHPKINLLKSAIRKSDGVKFKAGDWVKLKNNEEEKIIAFDRYKYPLPTQETDKPITEYHDGIFLTTVYKIKYKTIIRAIYATCVGFCFCDLDEWDWLPLNNK